MTASVGSTIVGSSRSSYRTSPGAYMTAPRMRAPCPIAGMRCGSGGSQHEVDLDQAPGSGDLTAVGGRGGRDLLVDVDQQRLTDAEDAVGVEVGVPAREDVRDQRAVAV